MIKTKRPNLFIIGAAKSGTTSLHYLLSQHNDIFLSEPKEPGFFVPELDYYPRNSDWYLSLFADAGPARYRGESSTHYTKRPLFEGVPERIASFVDEEPRFIYLMRDPAERALSNYWHNVRKHQEHRGLEAALEEVPEYLAVSDYAMQLEPYIETFGRHTIFATTFEALVDRPTGTVGDILEWLKLSTGALELQLEKQNARPSRFTRVRGRGLLARLSHSRLWDWISPAIPRPLKRMGRDLAYEAAAAEGEPVGPVLDRIRPRLEVGVYRLEALLGRSFDEWTTTLPNRRPASEHS